MAYQLITNDHRCQVIANENLRLFMLYLVIDLINASGIHFDFFLRESCVFSSNMVEAQDAPFERFKVLKT